MKLFKPGNEPFLVLGRAGMDLYADPPGTRTEEASRFTAALGGSAANIAATIVKLGGEASLLSTISDDAVGRFVVNELKRYRIGSSYLRPVGGEARNSLAVVESRLENCQSVIYRNGAADFELAEADVAGVDFASHRALIVTGTALAAEPSRSATFLAIARASESSIPVILDVDYRPYSWISGEDAATTCLRAANMCDIVIGNDTEFDVMAGGHSGRELASELASRLHVVIYKLGERGSITFAGGSVFDMGIYRVSALKPTGAGDAFMGGFVTGLSSGLDLQTCVRRGTAAAAIVVTRVGCAPASPTEAELDDFLENHPRPFPQ